MWGVGGGEGRITYYHNYSPEIKVALQCANCSSFLTNFLFILILTISTIQSIKLST
jgi:hypothetical protein